MMFRPDEIVVATVISRPDVYVVGTRYLVGMTRGGIFLGGWGATATPFWEGALKSYTPGPLSLQLFHYYFIMFRKSPLEFILS